MGIFDPSATVARLERAFAEIIAETTYGGAALAVWQEGKPLLSLFGGEASPGISWIQSTPARELQRLVLFGHFSHQPILDALLAHFCVILIVTLRNR